MTKKHGSPKKDKRNKILLAKENKKKKIKKA